MNQHLIMADRLVNETGRASVLNGKLCPYSYVNDLKNYCLWTAGRSDALLELGRRTAGVF